jgi:hypothetical protein
MEKKPCGAAEALRRVTPVQVDGKAVGIAWLEPTITDASAISPSSRAEIVAELTRRVKVYTYVPRIVEKADALAVFEE